MCGRAASISNKWMMELFFTAHPLQEITLLAPRSLLTLFLDTKVADQAGSKVLCVSLISVICTIGKGGVFLCFWLPGPGTEGPWNPGISLCLNLDQSHTVENRQGLCLA